jgi:ATP-binding protein involved in chromosome partitioning
MDGFLCPHCGEHVEIFPRSQEARELLDGLPLLASIPLDPATAAGGDKGQPIVVSNVASPVAAAFLGMSEQVNVLLKTQRTLAATEIPATQQEEAETTKGDSMNDERED